MEFGVGKSTGWPVLLVAGIAPAQEPVQYGPGRRFSDLTAAEQAAAKEAASRQPTRPLVACADPASMPFPDRHGYGMDDRIVKVLAEAIRTTVPFCWMSHIGRDSLKRTFGTAAEPVGHCDPLVGRGADVNPAGHGGVAALMIAAGYHDAPLVALLIWAGVAIEARGDDAKSALDIAKDRGSDVAESTLELMARSAPHAGAGPAGERRP